jgi:hypothetical protein
MTRPVVFRRATPGAVALAKKWDVKTLGDLSRIELKNVESLRSCVSAAKSLVYRCPMFAEIEIDALLPEADR